MSVRHTRFTARAPRAERFAPPGRQRAFPRRSARGARRAESGYILFMMLFMITVLLIGSMAAVERYATQGRRAREREMIWRGNQWARAIQMYYRKTGHYPSTADDLKKGIPNVHFLRIEAYKDPMNTEDGSWRFIYVNAAGQITGSVKYATLQQMAILDMNHGQIPCASNSSDSLGSADANSSGSQQGCSQGQNSQAGQNQGQSQSGGSNPGQTSIPQNGFGPIQQIPGQMNGAALAALAQLKPTGPVDGPLIGGFLTGVGGTVEQPAVKWYKGGKKYSEWEFIWNPLEDQMRAVQQGLNGAGFGGWQLGGIMGQGIGPGMGSGGMLNQMSPGSMNPGGPTTPPSPGQPQQQ